MSLGVDIDRVQAAKVPLNVPTRAMSDSVICRYETVSLNFKHHQGCGYVLSRECAARQWFAEPFRLRTPYRTPRPLQPSVSPAALPPFPRSVAYRGGFLERRHRNVFS